MQQMQIWINHVYLSFKVKNILMRYIKVLKAISVNCYINYGQGSAGWCPFFRDLLYIQLMLKKILCSIYTHDTDTWYFQFYHLHDFWNISVTYNLKYNKSYLGQHFMTSDQFGVLQQFNFDIWVEITLSPCKFNIYHSAVFICRCFVFQV